MRTALPPKIARALESACRTEAIDVVLQWIETRRDVLVLEGGTGAGKSVAAAWAFAYFAHRFRAPVWASVPEVATLGEWERKEWEPFDAASLIVLDDLGTERDTNASRAAMVLERLSNLAAGRCIITTNLPSEAIHPRYGERVWSRLLGSATWVTLSGCDLREQPPRGEPAPDPTARTKAEEEEATRRAAAARRRHDAELMQWENEAGARAEMIARMQAALAEKTGHCPISQVEADDNTRRRVLADQLDELRRKEAAS